MIPKKELIRCVRKRGSKDKFVADWRKEGGVIWVTKWTARKMKERGIIY